MKKSALLILTLIALVACNNNAKTDNQSLTTEESTENLTLETGCYEYKIDGNNIKMEITEVGDNVKANLNIAYAEKDANQGTFEGKLNGDKLIGIYTFTSEGAESTREMAFLVKDQQLIEGYGDLNENGTKFKDAKSITYNSTMPLTKVDCDK